MDDLTFSVDERIGDHSVSPDHVPLPLLIEFAKEVEQFLRGSNKATPPCAVSIVPGSLGIKPVDAVESPAWGRDFALLDREDTLGLLDPVRRKVVEKWQARARTKPGRVYFIRDAANGKVVRITKDTRFRAVEASAWVNVEQYLVGEVEDIGGSKEPNMHLRIDGKKVVVSATVEALRQIKENLLYKVCLVQITAEENLTSGELRNVSLVEAKRFSPAFDDDAYKAAKRNAESAWAEIPNAADWVRDIRGE